MRYVRQLRALGAVFAVAALAVPAAASAHPSVYTGEALVDLDPGPGVTPGKQLRHMVTNHNRTFVLRETNQRGAPMGVVSYALLPGFLNVGNDPVQQLNLGGTGAQAHHTCDYGPLNNPDAIRAWQGAVGANPADPFYNYVPFQKVKAGQQDPALGTQNIGLDDTPSQWIDDVLAITGVDLTTVPDDPAMAKTVLEQRCEALTGATFVPADEVQTSARSLALSLLEPLEEEIVALETFTEELEAQRAAAQRAAADARAALAGAQTAATVAQAEVARLSTRLRLEPTGRAAARRAAADQSVKVIGPAGMRVVVRLRLTRAAAKAIGWKSLVLGKEAVTLGQDGTALVDFALGRQANAALRKANATGVYFAARSGDRWASTRKR
jgi:hypothetical protein